MVISSYHMSIGKQDLYCFPYSKNISDKFLEVIDYCYLDQLVTFPAWASNIIDLLLTNRPSLSKTCKSTPGFGDHNSTILGDTQCYLLLPKPIHRKIHNWNKADIDPLWANVATNMDTFIQRYILQTPINDLLVRLNVTEMNQL